MTDELHYLELNQLAHLLAKKKLSPVELTKHYLARIDALDRQCGHR